MAEGPAKGSGLEPAREQPAAPDRSRNKSVVVAVLIALAGAGLLIAIGVVAAEPIVIPPTTHPASSRTSVLSTTSSSPGAATSSGGNLCSRDDLSVTTATDRASYSPGVPVAIVMRLTSRFTCMLHPVATGQYDCPQSLVVENSFGTQVFPVAGEGEQCPSTVARKFVVGTSVVETVVWDQRVLANGALARAQAGRYVVLGNWSWRSAPGGSVDHLTASSGFTIAR